MIDSPDIIDNGDTPDEWAAFSRTVSMLEASELEAINDYMGAGVAAGSAWQDYRDTFATYSWRDFTMAYEHVMRVTYS